MTADNSTKTPEGQGKKHTHTKVEMLNIKSFSDGRMGTDVATVLMK